MTSAADSLDPPRRRMPNIQQLRVPLGFVAAGLYLWFARPNPATLAAGAAVAFLGVLLRAWAAGHIVKNGRLATSGPYAHTRNPLYLGSLLIACGFALMATPWLLLAVAAFWAGVYGPVVAREAEHVRALHPDPYAEWAAHVPLFAPRLTPWRGGADRERFNPALYWYHKEWQAGLVFVLAVSWLAARAFGLPRAR